MLGIRNNDGQRSCELCETNGLVITGTPSPYKHTWVFPDGQTRSQIDHVLTKREFKNSVTDTKVNVASDRYHVWPISTKSGTNRSRSLTYIS